MRLVTQPPRSQKRFGCPSDHSVSLPLHRLVRITSLFSFIPPRGSVHGTNSVAFGCGRLSVPLMEVCRSALTPATRVSHRRTRTSYRNDVQSTRRVVPLREYVQRLFLCHCVFCEQRRPSSVRALFTISKTSETPLVCPWFLRLFHVSFQLPCSSNRKIPSFPAEAPNMAHLVV